MNTYESETYWARIYSSGPIEEAKNILRRECLREGLCLTVEPTTYIYTGGEEVGFVVGLVNYPRFPATAEFIHERALLVANEILAGCFQHSVMLMGPEKTVWITRRGSAP